MIKKYVKKKEIEQPALWLSSAEEEAESSIKLFFHRHLCTPAMSTVSSQVGIALFPSS